MTTPELDYCLTEMQRRGIDALVLGREANARAVSGADRLWLSGTRPFAASCVVVRKTAEVHLLANSNDGFEHFPIERCFPLTWSPAKLLGELRAIPGLTDAATVGVDGMSPAMHTLLGELVPRADFADAGPIFAGMWRVPSADKIQAVADAARVACNGLAAMAAFLRDGVRARVLRGVCAERFAALGVTTPAFEAVAAPIDGGASSWLAPERLIGAGEHVALRAGALRHGWEASLARTYVVDEPSIAQPPPDGWSDLVALCQAGTRVGHLRDLDAVVYGLGRGVEPYDDELALEAGMVLALELHRGRRLHQDVLHVTDNGPLILTADD
ncbi:MAG: M24 family metallopeptidase [Acidimicrobiia bacterium]